VIGAPYCGPPGMIGSECVYVFGWDPSGSHGKDETCFSLEQIPRMMAARMRGIQPAAALPTGTILFDLRAFKLIEPLNYTRSEVLEDLIQGKITKNVALSRLHQGWFYYEWTNNFACEKASTEDVTATRDISLAGCTQLGYNPVYCNWDAPVGHWKPWCVRGRPFIHQSEQVAETYRRALEAPIEADEILVDASQYNHETFSNDQKKD
jgi:hypothetical protein